MKKDKGITNTTEQAKSDQYMRAWVLGGNPRAIENQEAQGQQELVKSELLPTNIRGITQEKMQELGFFFGNVVSGDPLFQHVKLPEGWKKERTEHSMWSKLVDETGKERASIFYKAAFYDRNAFLSWSRE